MAALLFACSPDPAEEVESAATPEPAVALPADVLELGASVYEQTCAVCHYAGSGSATAPDLIGSAVLKEPAGEMIRIILHGRQGVSVVDGKKFNGIMPPQNTLPDEEIAAVVTFVRHQYGEVDELVPPSDVAAYR